MTIAASSSAASTSFTPALVGVNATRMLSTTATDYTTGAAPTSTTPVAPITLSTTPTSYLDVTFVASLGSVLDLGTVNGDELIIGGPGAAGVALVPGVAIYLGGTTFRYLLTGNFVPGAVNVSIKLDAFSDNSGRSPPAGLTKVQSFTVAGSTADAIRTLGDGSVVALAGSTIGTDALNATHYLEIRFKPSSGMAIDPATIDGNELQLLDPQGNPVALGSPVRVGTTDVWRYSFTATLVAGTYTLNFVAGSFGDTGGQVNLASGVHFTLASPTAKLADPTAGSVLDAGDFNGRGYVDVTFPAFDNNAVDPATLLDSGAEISITASDGSTITVYGVPAARGRHGRHVPLLLQRRTRPGR